jgi:uncharacterized protein YqjF (DUF2071 family)
MLSPSSERVVSMPAEPRFLTAEWLNLAMLNYEVDPAVLKARIPSGCELDAWFGRSFVSVVGFQFLRTRVLGIPIPFHRNFEEVNLRFYVRRKAEGTWRRGVVFIKEIVPRSAIAWVARGVYGENYVALPMRHSVDRSSDNGSTRLSYGWRRAGTWEGLSMTFAGSPTIPSDEAEETFITEHYWGYSRGRDGAAVEYQVEHPRWRVWRAVSSALSCDAASLYGPEFADSLAGSPSTAFAADGSSIVVRKGRRLA